jgi:hypothetical protein
MASLVPCTVCQRHVRHSESACPFCGAERQPTAAPSRERGVVRDAKRATLVALGLTLAGPACGGRGDDGDDSSFIVPYGLPPPDISEAGSGGAGGAAGSGGGGASGSTGGDEGGVTVPPYGAMPPIPDAGSGGGGGSGGDGADTPDSGTPPDGGGDDTGGNDDAGAPP